MRPCGVAPCLGVSRRGALGPIAGTMLGQARRQQPQPSILRADRLGDHVPGLRHLQLPQRVERREAHLVVCARTAGVAPWRSAPISASTAATPDQLTATIRPLRCSAEPRDSWPISAGATAGSPHGAAAQYARDATSYRPALAEVERCLQPSVGTGIARCATSLPSDMRRHS